MQIQVVTFHLEGLSGEDYLAACNQLAPAIAQVPGLISKTFIASRHSTSATLSHSRERVGRGSEIISALAAPREFSTRPAPARRSRSVPDPMAMIGRC